MVKVILSRAQSGGDQISVLDDNNRLLYQESIHLLPEKDGIVIIDTTSFKTDLKKIRV